MNERKSPRDWKEGRRLRAGERKEEGGSQRRIAQAFGVSEAAVSHWLAAATRGGHAAVRARPQPLGPRKLTHAPLEQLPALLPRGAEAYGFRGARWTCARVAVVIAKEFGVSYHKAPVSRLLPGVHGTPQIPLQRAAQRDETRITAWRQERWPALTKRPTGRG